MKKWLEPVLILEPLILFAATFFFWFPTPNPNSPPEFDRADWLWLLIPVAAMILVRFIVHDRLWTSNLLTGWLAAFIVLGVLNTQVAPYPSRGLMMLARPLLGMALTLYFAEIARQRQSMQIPLLIMIALSLLLGVVALGSTQWREKSIDFIFILERLPSFRPFFAVGGFNPNEIGGALAALVPLTAGLILYPWRWRPRAVRWVTWTAFILLLLALMFGQSRAAILGVFVALMFVILLIVPRGKPRNLALVGLGFLIVFEWAVIAAVFPRQAPPPELAYRDERTIGQRFDIWRSALDMVSDYPLTGVGMARFRYWQVRNDYPVPDFDIPIRPGDTSFVPRGVPHAHNAFLQVATDLGIPGLIAFTGWNIAAAYMLLRTWRQGEWNVKVVAAATAAGLLGHFIFSMGDAIPLWDRFSFIYWLLLGLAVAQYRQRF